MMPVAESLRARQVGALRTAAGSVRWRLWAPRHSAVRLVLGMGDDRQILPMAAEGDGYHSLELAGIASGTRYAYKIGDGSQDLPDPASRWQPDGVHRPSAVFFPDEFAWHDSLWRGLSMRDLVIYEIHVGTFTPEGTFAAVIERLAQLKELGVTAIEIMPAMQFPGTRNWGYDGVHPYAVQNSYGGPLGLLQLVDAAHAAGMGVILDVVYNHLGPEGNYLAQFGPYFTDRYRTPWGAALNYDGPDSDAVRGYVIDNACQWVRDFHIDGLRLDAVQTIYDLSAYHLLAELKAEVQLTASACGRSAVVIAETNQNDARITAAEDRHGFGLDGVWSDDFHHCVHALLTGQRDGYYADFGEPEQLARAYSDVFAYNGRYSPFCRRRHGSRVHDQPRERFVVCIQNHDQVGNRALGERLGTLLAPAAQRLAAALLLLSPNTPLLFMGEEYGETNPFLFFCSFGDRALIEAVREGRNREFAELAFQWEGEIPDPHATGTLALSRLSWRWEGDEHRSGLRRLYQTLLAARRSWPPLIDREHCSATVLNGKAATSGRGYPALLVVERGPAPGLIAVANLTAQSVALPSGMPRPVDSKTATSGRGHTPLLSTCEQRFGGQLPLEYQRHDLEAITELAPFELILWGDVAWT
ncbi:MAG TPA: malto-oligosyltrehalose trehalohydrolase [Pirellulaceae bacterium]|nr:malto-oligosyltrehalose trehalohydrolase [Pirellulaceae bacterium]